MSRMGQVVIIVPVYRKSLSSFDKISWRQLNRILNHCSVCIVAPEGLRELSGDMERCQIEVFPDEFFQDIASYSRLLLSSSFYERFQSYEYILIHQLDAFIFSDRLQYFCSLGYDYIGAPIPRWVDHWREAKARIGNGGLSLRKVQSMLRILREKGHLLHDHPMAAEFLRYEDLFFGYCGTLPDGLRVPSVSVALQFSVENEIGHCYRKMAAGYYLPFGCHAWMKSDYPFWKQRIESYGYELPNESGRQMATFYRRTTLRRYLLARMARPCQHARASKAVRSVLTGDGYAIWGYGKDGRTLLELLQSVGVSVECIMDRGCSEKAYRRGSLFSKPNGEIFLAYRGRLLLGSREHENDMVKVLNGQGFHEEKDFRKFSILVERIFSTYYGTERNG